MYTSFDEKENRFNVIWMSVNMVPEFKALVTNYGQWAYQYLLYWEWPNSPFFEINDPTEKHDMIMAAMMDTGNKFDKRFNTNTAASYQLFYKDPVFLDAQKIFIALEDNIEGREERAIRRARANVIRSLELDNQTQDPDEKVTDQYLEDLQKNIKSLSEIQVHHKKAQKDRDERIKSDNNRYSISM